MMAVPSQQNSLHDQQPDDWAAVLAEQFDIQLARLVERVDDRIAYRMKPIQGGLNTLKTNMTTVKSAITATNTDLRNDGRRVSQLENTAFND